MSHPDPLDWLKQSVLPLWLARGVDGLGFLENLSFAGEPIPGSRRCMVQARQIYSLRVARDLRVAGEAPLRGAIAAGADSLTRRFSLPSGAFRHAIHEDGSPKDDTPDLYGQAFALFGLAEAYAVLGEPALKERALALVAYLRRERRAPGGGFTELVAGKAAFQSNPHMHLYEAALAWLERDADPAWAALAAELLELCLSRFIDPATGALGEFFAEGWERELEAGRFVYEPGHLCEWAWLMGRHQRLAGRDLLAVRERLFALSERTGLDPARGVLIDQVWSDGRAKKRSARFWPQCERTKAAAQMGKRAEARAAMAALFRYFETPKAGLWLDTWNEDGSFSSIPAKASSLYHIIGAISELARA